MSTVLDLYEEALRIRRELAAEAGLNPDVIEQMYVTLIENFIEEEKEILRQRQEGEKNSSKLS